MKPSKRALANYLIWVSLNLFFFVTGDDKFSSNNRFCPLDSDYYGETLRYYDWTELIFYCFVPVILWVVIKLLRSAKDEENQKLSDTQDHAL